MANIGIDLAMFKPFLQVIVDGFIGDFAQKREIRNADFLLFGDLECGLFDLWLPGICLLRLSPAEKRGFGYAGCLPIAALCLTLRKIVNIACDLA